MRTSFKSVVAGVLTLCVAGVISAAGATSASAAVSPFDPDTNPNAYGTIIFYDAAGNVVTSGANAAQSPKFAVASKSPNSTVLNSRAGLWLFNPQAGQPTGNWNGTQMNTNTVYPLLPTLTTPPTTIPASVGSSTFPATMQLPTSQSFAAIAATFVPNTGALANLFQVRLKSVQLLDYASATISIDPATGAWQQVFPVPAIPATATTTTLGVSPASPATAPASPTLTATVSPATAAGTMEFFDGTTLLGTTPSPVTGGVATKILTGVAAGSHSYTARFTPTTPTAFTPSTSTAATYQVNAPATATSTSTTLGVSPASPATAPASPTLTATVSPATAAGTMEFFDGTTLLGTTPSPVTGGVATKTLTGVAAGSHSYTAKFTPTTPTAFTPSTSTAATYQVNAPLKATPTVGLASSSAASVVGDTVTFTATITNPNAAGTVEFFDGATSLAAASAANAGGVATYTTSALTVGTHLVRAKFTPTNTTANNPATSTAVSVTVSAVTPPNTMPIVKVTQKPAVLTRSTSATFTYAGSDGSGATRTWTYFCSLDGAAYTACLSTKSYTGLSTALHTFRVKAVNSSGTESDPVSHTWTVDAVLPSVSLGALPAFTLTSSITPTWTAKDVGAGVANTDVRWTRSSWSAGWSAWVYPSQWQRTTAAKATMYASRGYTYCFAVRTRDKAGNTSAWSANRCTSAALDDRILGASAGWSRVTSGRFYVGTATATTRQNVTLTRTRVQTRRIALVATRCPTCGIVGVYLNGILINKVNLYAATTSRRSILPVAVFSRLRSGTVTVRTLTRGKAIQIDGLGLSRV